jgi:intracellular sulfur oxidation DsrE/DsrF family protein
MPTTLRPNAFLRLIAGLVLALGLAGYAAAAPLNDQQALSGLHEAKAVFLVSVNDAGHVAHVLRVIGLTEKGLREQHVTPHLIVVFVGPDVAFLTRDRRGIGYMDERAVAGIHRQIEQMHKAGVQFQACGIAMKGMDVKPDMLIPGVQAVGNGYISAIGYQAKGYSLLPVY